jgi:hypothetical protein|tara:strand:- start:38837 stop:39040 length:204 start_codon:yes stop_codon:yes gene_type:complete
VTAIGGLRSCRCKKVCHRTKASAEEQLGALLGDTRTHRKKRARLNIYWCKFSRSYHVGHLPKGIKAS